MNPQDPHQVARATVAAMYAADLASRALGIAYDPADIGPGRATVTLTVSEAMVNGHGACHGGVLFTLADTAFGFACNSYGPQAVAHVCEIVYARPVLLGDVLVATATERVLYGRSGVYDVTVTRPTPEGAREVVAEFRGHSRVVGKRS
jgi:phenylacetic acid degradation protein PaaD